MSAWYINTLHRIAAQPAIYDAIQRIVGMEKTRRQLKPFLLRAQGIVLDIGAGTGNYKDLLPSPSCYVWFDNAADKLVGFRKKHPTATAVLGDAAHFPLCDKSVDFAMCVFVSHHLDSEQVETFFHDLARVCRRGLIFLDAVDRPESVVSRLLWRYDRGSYPRRPEVLRALIERYFVIEKLVEYRIYHQYLLCLAVPKALASPRVVH